MINPLNDKKFLYELDKQKNHTTYIKVLALDKDERPLQQIEGRATGGSINIDGNSAVRRTCSLTMISEQYDIIDAYWALKNKFKLEIGIKNTTNQYLDYPIIWFKMGTFGINAFSKNTTTTGITLNISGQDKMCFLNGTLGGSLTASTNFGEEEFINGDGSITLKKIPLKDIITKAIHTYANEPMHNIIIRDLDDVGYELWDFKGGSNEAMYVFYTKNENSAEYDQIFNTTFMGNMKVKLDNQDILLSEITNDQLYHRNRISGNDGVIFKLGTIETKISKVLYGEAAGYYKTPLIYAGDLIVNAGQPLTQMLDNIKNMLGEYEYFYDVDGHFIFQKKRTYIQGIINFDGSLPITSLPEYSYKFEDEELMTSIQITSTIADVRNDLAVWGSKKSITGATLSPYGRIAVQGKPTKYVAFDGNVYDVSNEGEYNGVTQYALQTNDQYIKLYDICPTDNTEFEIAFAINSFKDAGATSGNTGTIFGNNQFYLVLDNKNKTLIFNNAKIELTDNDLNKIIVIAYKDKTLSCIIDGQQKAINTSITVTTEAKKFLCLFARNNDGTYNNRRLDIHFYYLKLYNTEDGLNHILCPDKRHIKGQVTKPNEEKFEYNDPGVWAGVTDVLNGTFYLQSADNEDPSQNIKYVFSDKKIPVHYNLTPNWRELIYQMAKDYMEHHDEYDFEVRLAANNTPMFSTGRTGYEQYYTDILGFWRQLYWVWGLDEPAAANFSPADYLPSGWHVNKEYSPESLLFWFDLLEPNGGLNPYAIETIGDRTKVDNNKSATSLYIKETPNILFAIREKDNDSTTGESDFTKINISQSIADNVFSISTQGKSVLDALDELIYKHVLLAEGINLSLIPIYHIEPNTRIYLKNTDSNYIVTQMSIPLAYNGTMSITATKIVPYIN